MHNDKQENYKRLWHQSIQDYLDMKGIQYDSMHGYLKLRDHDSCVVDTRISESHPYETFNWNSRGLGGDFKNFLTDYMGFDKQTVRSELRLASKDTKYHHKTFVEKKVPFNPEKYEGTADHGKVTSYLVNQRHLNQRTVDALFKNDCIRQTKDGDALFVWHDKNRKMVGGDIQGTQINHSLFGKRGTKKKILPNSERQSGFVFQTGKGNDILAVFESPIDALSYYEMNQISPGNKNITYLSLNGSATKIRTIENYVKTRGMNPKEIRLCFDTDRAGQTAAIKFIKEYKLDYNSNVELNGKSVLLTVQRPDRGNKDWNEGRQKNQNGILSNKASDFISHFNKDQLMQIVKDLDPKHQRMAKARTNSQNDISKNRQPQERAKAIAPVGIAHGR